MLDGFRGSSWDILTKGTLLSECSFMVKSWGWVVVAHEILLSALGLGVVSILDSHFSFLDSWFSFLNSWFSILNSQFSILFPGPRSQVPSPKSQSQSLDNFLYQITTHCNATKAISIFWLNLNNFLKLFPAYLHQGKV